MAPAVDPPRGNGQLASGTSKGVVRVSDPGFDAGDELELLDALLAAHRQLEFPDLLDVLLAAAAGWAGAQLGFALGEPEEGRRLQLLASTLGPEDPRGRGFLSLDPGMVRRGLGEQAVVFDGLGPVESYVGAWSGPLPGACAALPVCDADGRWRAALLLMFDRRPADGALARAIRLIEQARPAVGNAMRVRRMRELVIKDDTAQCFNRRHFEESLPEELSRASRFRAPLSLIFLDMDNLKQINNRYGHPMGSRTLNEVAVRIRRKIRKFDKLFRFGGDEFCILLPETAWHGAMEVAERVRDAVARKPFLITELGPDSDVWMTASLGIASYPLHARTGEELVQLADRAMQQIKRRSKDGIGVAQISEDEDDGG